ncbi:pleiotropic drug resistance protein 1-like [Senna tora]|uniref:Pleiotropic drug resistance protein 1-like n=1 Tax=Senna tora TaxID=362788 RepID=A0A835CB52_9FABA|nr:pleiotropic drug resistance protein 1-like [Senna tora]
MVLFRFGFEPGLIRVTLTRLEVEDDINDTSFWTSVMQPVNTSEFNVPELTGDNYKIWKEKVILQLGWMDIDYAIRKNEPHVPTHTSSKAEISLYELWEGSNRLSIMFIKTKISASLRGSIGEHKNGCDLLKAIDEQFEFSYKALSSTLMTKLSSMKLTSISGVRDHIMRMRDIAAQLKNLEVEMSDTFLVMKNQSFEESQPIDYNQVDLVVQQPLESVVQPVEDHIDSTLRRLTRTRRSAIPSDYSVYLQEVNHDIGAENDPKTFSQAMSCRES